MTQFKHSAGGALELDELSDWELDELDELDDESLLADDSSGHSASGSPRIVNGNTPSSPHGTSFAWNTYQRPSSYR